MQSKGRIYGVLFVVIIIVCGFFFSSKFWLPDDRSLKNLNYDQVLTLGDWMIRFQDASFDKTAGTMTVNVLEKAQLATDGPFKVAVYLGDKSLGKKLPFQLNPVMDKPNLQTLSIEKIPADFYYVTVEVVVPQSYASPSSETPTGDSSQDIFGTDSTVQQKEQPITAEVHIDYRKIHIVKNAADKKES
ncbi:hypothetical protein [Ethanoligenens sp.]|uniref:hypothetical protein n=1 Tax=Ethanoligenens sp. TaxID=2099655 RepID=UPI0039EA4DBC